MMQRYISENDLQTFVDTQMQSFNKTLALAEKVNSKQISDSLTSTTLAQKALLESMMDYLDENADHISINEDGENEVHDER